jgi:hypothetical protein
MSAMNKDLLVKLFEIWLDGKFESFFQDPDIEITITAIGVTSADARLAMRDLLRLAHVAGAEALAEMLSEDEDTKH